MNKIIFFLVLILTVGVVGFLLIHNRNSQKTITTKALPTPTQIPTPTPTPRQLTVTLKEENKSGESGTATLTELNGKVNVVLSLTGAPSGVAQPAHIHVGACPGVGVVKYPLTNVMDGASNTTLPDGVTFDSILAGLPLAINVHKSATAMGVYVACGPITTTPSATTTVTPTGTMMHVTPTEAMMMHMSPTAAPTVSQ